MSSKIITKTSIGIQKPNNELSWSPGVAPRMAKAKSSPNVSKLLFSPKPSPKPEERPTQVSTASRRLSTTGNRSGSSKTTVLRNPPASKPRNNVTVVQIQSESPTPATRASLNKQRQEIGGKNLDSRSPKISNSKVLSPRTQIPKGDQKKKSKESSLSCTILEDRALLKKGLHTTPEKLPNKPEELRKKALNRSTSLWNVPVDSEERQSRAKSIGREPRNLDGIQKEGRSHRTLDRTTSLWNVPADAGRISRTKSISGLRPSRIPLSTQHFGLGQSLADLTQVDRNAEKIVQRIIDLDEVDRSIDEHIYENCQEAIIRSNDQVESKESVPIYENLKKRDIVKTEEKTKKELNRTKSAPLQNQGTLDLERRAQELMSQLDEDDDPIQLPGSKGDNFSNIQHVSNLKHIPKVKDILKVKDVSKSREELRSKESFNKTDHFLQKIRVFAKSQESLIRKESEMSIQEIRRNWEMQIKKSQKEEPETEIRKSIPQKKNLTVEKTNSGKRAKDIEHLVNFFNTKNTEASKEAVQDTWTKIKDTSSQLIKDKKEKDEKNSGYVSDGNCSEDSGHMSNENETEEAHQELKTLGKNERFLEEIIQDLDHSLEHTMDIFEATPIVQRYVPQEEEKIRNLNSSLSNSSGTSSIESWETMSKTSRGITEKQNWKSVPISKTNGAISSSVVATHRPQVAAKPAPLDITSQIFFRAGALERLESQRDEKLTGHIILLQARCRGYLARRKLNTLKLQDLAVRCIQRNVRKLMSVREWPWWRLYVKIAPLLNVHRTEDQLKARQEELEILRAKVERLEQERNHLKHDNDKLEAKLSEMTADYAEEHSTSTLAAERIDAETSERHRLERELQDVTETNKNLQQATERLEMELLYARAADLNGIASDGEDGEDGGVYKQRYEHAMRELEFFKRKMAQQHEDDLEQLVGLKKQLEKKLADAYEEVEEQRQVVGQWKRRVQKLNGEMHDLRLLLEEQTARNNLLEKKQRKFDSETQNLMDDLRQEKAQRERLAREKEIVIAEKFTVEQNLSDARLEIELKEERLHTLTQELEELTFGGKTEEEVAQLKKMKHELEKKCKDQEEELDDLAGQVQLLEQAKLRLEMSIEQQRKEMRKEMQQRDEELEDVRGNAHKKVKSLEAQLENEHEERTILLREKHELERRLVSFEEQDRTDRAAEAETTQRLKRDLKRTKALLRDAQTMLERSKCDSTGKAALRQLKNQLEDAECARSLAVKAKQALEQDLNETQAALEEASRQRSEAEDRANAATRERAELISQLEENEEELAEVLKKYRAAVQQVSTEQAQLQETQVQIAALEAEKSSLKDQLTELSQRLESVEQLGDPTANSLATKRLEFRTKELESKLELEQTTRARLETQIARLKEAVDKLQTEAALLRTKEQTAQDAARRLQRSLREAKEEAASAMAREQEATRARRDVEKSLEAAEAETKVVRDDLRLALQRIDDLQSAIQGELDLDCSEEATSDNSDSD